MDPALIMLWGVTTERVQRVGKPEDGGVELRGAPGVARASVEGVARVVIDVRQIARRPRGRHPRLPDHVTGLGADLPKVKAVVTDIGGVMSHAAIVCREYGLPAVVGTGRATAQISTGQRIRVDGTAGTVTILEAGSDPPA